LSEYNAAIDAGSKNKKVLVVFPAFISKAKLERIFMLARIEKSKRVGGFLATPTLLIF
jgi:hypothetical protein